MASGITRTADRSRCAHAYVRARLGVREGGGAKVRCEVQFNSKRTRQEQDWTIRRGRRRIWFVPIGRSPFRIAEAIRRCTPYLYPRSYEVDRRWSFGYVWSRTLEPGFF